MSSGDDTCDVLIIGAGPSGLMSAAWLSRLGVKTRIIDKRGSGVVVGHADGFHGRTMEVLVNFDAADEVLKCANPFSEFAIWNGVEGSDITRASRSQFLSESLPNRFMTKTTSQGYVEQGLRRGMAEHGGLKVEFGKLPIDLVVDESKAKDPNAYPVTINLKALKNVPPFQMKAHTKDTKGNILQQTGQFFKEGALQASNSTSEANGTNGHAAEAEGVEEIVHAKYVIGSDGGHSWTRTHLGVQMEGEDTDSVFGVLDVVPITNFPDIRRPAVIGSGAGSLLNIPREKGLNRIYVQMAEVQAGEGRTVKQISPLDILEAARKIMHPYEFDYHYCDWWTAYVIGQRVGEKYSDPTGRVFLAGDAVHTHSPKGGQGMNVGILDSNNIAWKLGGVLKGYLKPEVLETYEIERRRTAEELINFDKKLAQSYVTKPSVEELFKTHRAYANWTNGLSCVYKANVMTASAIDPASSILRRDEYDLAGKDIAPSPASIAATSNAVKADQNLAPEIPLGVRFPSFDVKNHASSGTTNLQNVLTPDGQWRLIVFSGAVAEKPQMARLQSVAAAIEPLRKKYTLPTPLAKAPINLGRLPENGSRGAHFRIGSARERIPVLDCVTVHCSSVSSVELHDFPAPFLLFDEQGGYDYNKIFTDNEEKIFTDKNKEGNAQQPDKQGCVYDSLKIDKEQGCMVLVRPDMVTAWIGAFADGESGVGALHRFIDRIFVAA